MKLGVFTCLLSNLPLESALKYFQSLGIQMVEIGCGGTAGNAHANPDILLHDDDALKKFSQIIDRYGME
ncbi:MAG: sugar phosphate isomerase/epimerase, partial [Clostridium sp.]